MDASFRMFSLFSTCAFCPTLRRLGTLVLQDALCTWVGAGDTGVSVGASPATVGVEATVGGSVATEVGVALGSLVGGTGERVGTSVAFEAGEVTMTSVGLDTKGFSVGDGGAAGVAQPRRSMRRRITTRTKVTIDLNRS